MQELDTNLYIETDFYGGTVGAIVTDEGVICIDTPPLPSEARRWRSQLAHLTSKSIILIINTSHNPTRILGNRWFNASVLAHQYTVELLKDRAELFRANYVLPEEHDTLPELTGVRPIRPEITFSESMTIYRGNHVIKVLHRSGTAASGVWVHIPETNITFIGDTIIRGGNPLLYSANINQWLEDLRELAKPRNNYNIIVPGQGQPTTEKVESAKYIADYLRWMRKRLQRMVRSRKTEEDLAAFVPKVLAQFPVSPLIRPLVEQQLLAGLPTIYAYMQAAAAPAPEPESEEGEA